MTLLELKKNDKNGYGIVMFLALQTQFGIEPYSASQRDLADRVGITRGEFRGALTRLENIGFTLNVTPDSFLIFDDIRAFKEYKKPKEVVRKQSTNIYKWKLIENPTNKMETWYNYFLEKVVFVCPKLDNKFHLSYEDFVKLCNVLGNGYPEPEKEGVVKLKEYYMAFSNNTEYQKGKTSLYLTFRNWKNLEKNRR